MKFFTRKQKEMKKRAEAQSPLLKVKIKPILPLIAFTLMFYTQTVLAEGSLDTAGTDKIVGGLNDITSLLQTFGAPIFAVAVVATGFMMMSGERGIEKGKSKFIWSSIGLLVCNFAQPIAMFINSIK